MKPAKVLTIIVLTGVIMIALCFWRCPIQPKVAMGQVKPLKFKPLKLITTTKDCVIYHVPVLYQDIPSPKPPKPKWLKLFIGDYREYSAECYADSGISTSLSSFIFNDSTGLIEFDTTKFDHRQPTLPGFMQFLEEKYKN